MTLASYAPQKTYRLEDLAIIPMDKVLACAGVSVDENGYVVTITKRKEDEITLTVFTTQHFLANSVISIKLQKLAPGTIKAVFTCHPQDRTQVTFIAIGNLIIWQKPVLS